MPDWTPDLRSHLSLLHLAPEREAEILEELSQHLDDRWQDLISGGTPSAEAEGIVRSEIGASLLRNAMGALRQADAGRSRPNWPAAYDTGDRRPAWRIWRRLGSELVWAFRAIRSRGWRAGIIVLLIGLALAGNVLVFAVADSVVFRRVPYPHPEQLVEIQQVRTPGGRGNGFMSPALLDTWRTQTDLFASVQAYLTKAVFVVADGRSQIVATADLTPGLMELLGARPGWGRSLIDADARETTTIPSLISAGLARELFGTPAAALNQTIVTTAQPLLVVGVMPDGFLFPNGSCAIWRAMDPRGPLTKNFAGVHSIARTQPDLSPSTLTARLTERSRAVGEAAGAGDKYAAVAGPVEMVATGPEAEAGRAMFLTLLGGALCLLLTACANAASLEVAGAMQRARTFAVQLALGASRGALARLVLLEGALLTGTGLALGTGLAWAGVSVLRSYLPVALTRRSVNPIDLDGRALVYMAAIALATWLIASLPTVFYSSHANLLGLLKSDDRTTVESRRGALVRRGLTVLEIAIAVVLVVGGFLYTRSYLALLNVDKGFDSTNLVEIGFAIPVEYYDQAAAFRSFSDEVLTRVRAVPGVVAAVDASAPPSRGTSPFGDVAMEIDGRRLEGTFTVGDTPVDPAYFRVVGLKLQQGRWFEAGEPPTNVIVTDSFARQFWPDRQAVGQTFRRLVDGFDLPSGPVGLSTETGAKVGAVTKPAVPPDVVIGVVSDFRSSRPTQDGQSSEGFYYYTPRQPLPPPPPTPPASAPRVASTGGSWRLLNLTVRLDSTTHAPQVLEAARNVDRRLRVTLESVDVQYADMFADVLLATRVTTAFAGVAFVVAIVGVYGVMAFLVVGRRREIGIRMALGAGPGDIARLVVANAATLVALGIVLGTVGAVGLARWTTAQFFGVSAVAPSTYIAVGVGIAAAALVATWQPARQAARVDPAVTLRGD